MTVTIPASDAQSTQLNGVITALTTLIANNPSSAAVSKLTRDKANAQHALVVHLLGTGHLSAASILTNETYVTGPAVSDGQ